MNIFLKKEVTDKRRLIPTTLGRFTLKKTLIFFLITFLLYLSYTWYRSTQVTSQIVTDDFLYLSLATQGVRNLPHTLETVRTADSDAHIDAATILQNFYHLSDMKHKNLIVSGQNIGHASEYFDSLHSSYKEHFVSLKTNTGELPVLMGIDYGWEQLPRDYSKTNELLIEHWNNGGLISISVSPTNPFTGKGLRDFTLGGYSYDSLFDVNSVVHKRWIADLDQIASGLKELQDAGVVVLWRPLHEMNGDFFWWSYGEQGRVTPDEFTKLWRFLFEYFTQEKDLHNLLWVYAPNATLGNSVLKPVDYYYPGDAYVDIVGIDYYWNDLSLLNSNGDYDTLVSIGKPLGLTEVGALKRSGFDNLEVLNAINTHYPQITFVLYWHGWGMKPWLNTKRSIGENANAEEFMHHPLTLTLSRWGQENGSILRDSTPTP